MSPGVTNLFSLLKAAGDLESHAQMMDAYKDGNLRYGELKVAVGDALVKMTNTFKANKAEINANKKELKSQIKASSATIRLKAQETLAGSERIGRSA